jgi:DNA replication protein DnaC
MHSAPYDNIVKHLKTPLPNWAMHEPGCGKIMMNLPGVRELCIERVGEAMIGTVPYCSCDKQTELNARTRFIQAGLPAGFPKTLQNFVMRSGTEDASAAAQDFLDMSKTPPVLTFSGTVGSGKSHLAEAITREILIAGHSARYELVSDLLRKLRPPDDGAVDLRDATMNACTNAYLLWLDDAFSEKPSEWAADQLFQLIDERVRNRRRLIVTTNHNPNTMPKIFYRITDRLMDTQTGTSRWVTIDASSYRTNRE